jgi:hypothetical protein
MEKLFPRFSSEAILMIVEHACLPFSSNHFMRGDCKDKHDAIIDFLDSNTSIKAVYLAGYWSYLMTGGSGKEGTRWRNSLPVYGEVAKLRLFRNMARTSCPKSPRQTEK